MKTITTKIYVYIYIYIYMNKKTSVIYKRELSASNKRLNNMLQQFENHVLSQTFKFIPD